MIPAALERLGDGLLVAGAFFIVTGVVGVLRLPDFYTRLHAMGKCDTLGVGLMVLGLALQQDDALHVLKLLLILVFVGLANPVATHALGRAALKSGLEPWRRGKAEEKR
ncbi:MAG TPA: monovalent cation/H(+) antiporter subunit G [Vicinamibacteria bacterium]|nr:monovalent cation/H(+) antiporter subunit G [Vicinamibacteria bacterium]